jgi:hypothetical protein
LECLDLTSRMFYFYLYIVVENLPFGGVGASGLGSYHSKYSFETFSHKRAVVKGSTFGDFLMGFVFKFFLLRELCFLYKFISFAIF